MKARVVLSAVAAVVGATVLHAADKTDAQAIQGARMSMTEAIQMAERQGNGKAIDAKFGATKEGGQYAIEVLSNDGKKLTEYKLDSSSGRISAAGNEPFERVFTRLTPEDLEQAQTSLSRAISTAERETGGKVVKAETERSGDK
ncbi:MAG: PepSY domain-containing protein, partial [Sinobacteraceae bacterium]|nr:PepSY domain-containing protein [Nevskiaceae bacterium]